MDEYEFEVHETKTYEVIEDVKNRKSEIGILHLNDFNRNVLRKLFSEYGLLFQPLLECGVYVYLWKGHPLANKKEIVLEELEEYPCLAFAQGEHNYGESIRFWSNDYIYSCQTKSKLADCQ